MTVRKIPAMRFGAIGWLVLAVVVAAMSAWEWRMRALGLRAGDLDDSKSHWAVERRKVAAGDHDGVVIIGSSRILFDTDLELFEEMTGRKPVQLALPGTNPRAYLKDLADNGDFAGLLIVGVTPDIFFTDWPGIPIFAGLIEFWKDESPSQRFGHVVGLELSRHLAFIDYNYRLGALIERVPLVEREGVRGPMRDVWKLSESYDDRQYFMWRRFESDPRLIDHARWVWGPFDGALLDDAVVAKVCDEAREQVEKIRARGGEVVFIRAPSAGLYYESELRGAPRARTWTPLLQKTGAFGIHFEDYPEMQNLDVPEWSHLSRESAKRFTRAYVEALARKMPWLRSARAVEPAT